MEINTVPKRKTIIGAQQVTPEVYNHYKILKKKTWRPKSYLNEN
jgi:hypothetical protein